VVDGVLIEKGDPLIMIPFVQRILPLGILILTIGVLTGCLGTRGWEYPPGPHNTYLGLTAPQSIPAKLVVLPLEDHRGSEVQEEYWKVAIPLIPSSTTFYDRPETAVDPEQVDVVLFDPPQDFSRALADEIREAGIFSSVAFSDKSHAPPSDLIMRGRLKSTRWERNISTYLLGPVGTVFWILGLPMGNTTTTLELDLQITPAGNPSNVLWSFKMEFEGEETDGPYYGLEEAIQSYPAALQNTLRPAVTNLVEIGSQRPELLNPF